MYPVFHESNPRLLHSWYGSTTKGSRIKRTRWLRDRSWYELWSKLLRGDCIGDYIAPLRRVCGLLWKLFCALHVIGSLFVLRAVVPRCNSLHCYDTGGQV